MVNAKLGIIVKFVLFAGFGTNLVANPISTIDFTERGSSEFLDGAFFQQIDPQATGTGVLDPFLTIQGNGSERGYNTDARSKTATI